MTIQAIMKKYSLTKTNDILYTHNIYLENLKTNWLIKIEKPTRKCKFYSVYTRFENQSALETINKIIDCNTYSGKCNRFYYNLDEIENFINNVITINKLAV